jgi:DNA-binding response OmpR family regulator
MKDPASVMANRFSQQPVDAVPNSPDPGDDAKTIRVLSVARRVTATQLDALFANLALVDCAEDASDRQLEPIEFVSLTNQKAALGLMRKQPPKVVLVEVDERPNSRVRFCEMIRYRLPSVAIFAVGKQEPAGAFDFDGFIELPLNEEAVLAEIRRIRNQFARHVLTRGPIRLNVATRTVFTSNGQHHMTPKQCSLLQMLMENCNRTVSRSEIMASIWETSYLEDTRTLDVHIRWLRERIEPDPSNPIYLLTVRGMGYHLHVP